MYIDKYINTDAEELFESLEGAQRRALEMFREFKQINLQLAAVELYSKEHCLANPIKELYIHGRTDTDDLYIKIGEAQYNCESIESFVDYIDKKITDPELKVFNDAFWYIKKNGDNGTFSDMLNLYHEVMKLYKATRKTLNKLDNSTAAHMESITLHTN